MKIKKEIRVKILQGNTLSKKMNDLSKMLDKKQSFELTEKKKELDKRIKFYETYLKEVNK